jgi:hypothetical protein
MRRFWPVWALLAGAVVVAGVQARGGHGGADAQAGADTQATVDALVRQVHQLQTAVGALGCAVTPTPTATPDLTAPFADRWYVEVFEATLSGGELTLHLTLTNVSNTSYDPLDHGGAFDLDVRDEQGNAYPVDRDASARLWSPDQRTALGVATGPGETVELFLVFPVGGATGPFTLISADGSFALPLETP